MANFRIMNNKADFTIEGARRYYAPDVLLEPKHMDLILDIDIEKRIIEGSNTITVVSNSDLASSIAIDAVDFEEIDVVVEGANWSYDDKQVNIYFDTPITKGKSLDIKITYKVVDPIAGLYFSDWNADLQWVGSDHETERARYWFPCVDYPNIRTTYRWEIRSKNEYKILAIGELLEEKGEGDTKTAVWEHNFPCPSYIAAITLGHLTEYSDEITDAGKGLIPVAYFAPGHTASDLKRSFGRTPEMIKWYINKFNYHMEWAKYYQYALPDIGGAMENQSLVSWDDKFILPEKVHEEWGFLVDQINIHEMAHTFFGDQIVMSHFSHAWLKESWAVYVECLWLQDKNGEDEFRYDLYRNSLAYFNEADNRYIRPIVHNVYNTSWQLFDGHLYPGGGWRLHMLRVLLGDKQFFASINDYVSSFSGKLVETVDFKRILEKHSGLNLTSFFDDWLLTPKGYPNLKVKYEFQEKKKRFRLEIRQKQIKKDDEFRSKPFSLKLDIEWEINDEFNIQEVEINSEMHTFYFKVEDKPTQIRVDPNGKVLFKLSFNPGSDLLISQLQNSDVVGRILATNELCKAGKSKGINSVISHYGKEKFHGVREQIIKALVKTNSKIAVDALSQIIAEESEPRILFTLMNEVGKLNSKGIELSLIEFIKNTPYPRAKGAALVSLGKQRKLRNKNFINLYLNDEDWQYFVRASAFEALAELRDNSEIPHLLSSLGSEPHQVRKSVISSLVKLAGYDNQLYREQVIEALTTTLQDPHRNIRIAAARGLGTLKARSAIASIENLKARHPQQEEVVFDKLVSLIKKAKPGEQYSTVLKDLEKLEKKVQLLEKDLMDLKAEKDTL